MGLFNFFKGKQPNIQWEDAQNKGAENLNYDSRQIVEKLEELGYFKYADTKEISEIKAHLVDSLTTLNYLDSPDYEVSPFCSKDYRHYVFDGETLFEEGGFMAQLQDMKTLFGKMDFKIEVSNHIEEWSNENGLNHFITLNGKEYIIFKNFNTGYGWGEAAQRFAEIINEQLELQNKDERLYLMYGGNDGRAVYLTEAQFALLEPVLKGIERPLKIEDWCRVHEVDRQNYNQG